MRDPLTLALCDTQGQLFVLAGERGYASVPFIRSYMSSRTAADMDLAFHHVQWAGKAYVLERLEEECGSALVREGEVYDREALYWMGYLYRWWHLFTGESSRVIYRRASAERMNTVYLMYHTMSPELAVEKLKE